MTLEHITAAEYLKAEEMASRNGADKPAFGHIVEGLRSLPMTQQRLAIELLEVARLALLRGKNPGKAALPALEMWRSITEKRLPEYLALIEDVAVQCLDLMSDARDSRFIFTLTASLLALRTLDNRRLHKVLERVERGSLNEVQRQLLAQATESESQSGKRLRELRAQRSLQLAEYGRPSSESRN